jgi:SAM-dependent methyltransferase
MPTVALPHRTTAELSGTNREFDESLWASSRLVDPSRFNTWPMVRELAMALPRRLEVAPGLRPRLPLDGTYFVDISRAALAALRAESASAMRGTISALPCPDASFDLICALDILQYVADDDKALRELSRVAAPDARLLLSVPLHPEAGIDFADIEGDHRRYQPRQLQERLGAHGWTIERSATYGTQPASSRLLALGQRYLKHRRDSAQWWYDHVIEPLELRLQKPLHWRPGLGATDAVDELILLCRRA